MTFGDTSSKTPPPPSPEVIKFGTLHHSCDKLPLDIYIDCLLDNDLSGLIISGNVTPEELTMAWDKIYAQACEISSSKDSSTVFSLVKEINDLKAKINLTYNILTHLQMSFDEDLVAILNSFALMCTITAEDSGEVLDNKLNTVIAYMKKWFPRLELKEIELEKIRSESKGTTDRGWFDDWLDAIGEAKGYNVQASQITVTRFYRNVTTLSEQAKIQSIKAKKRA